MLTSTKHYLRIGKALVLAVMPEDDHKGVEEAVAFLSYVRTAFPDTASHWEAVDSERVFVETIEASDDGDGSSVGVLHDFSAGIVFSSGSPDWKYKVGMLDGGTRSAPGGSVHGMYVTPYAVCPVG